MSFSAADYGLIPQRTLDSIEAYINRGVPTGGFLRFVLENNLLGAVLRADEFNGPVLNEIVTYLYDKAPGNCWGSKERVEAWLNGEWRTHRELTKGHNGSTSLSPD